MVRNVKVLEGKQYTTRKIRKVLIDQEESESRQDRDHVLKEKNRQSAQRSRDNKKKYIVGLELRIAELEAENQELKHRLAACQCQHKLEDAKPGHPHAAPNGPAMNIQNISGNTDQTQSGGDSFERLSMRSFVSCSNFLMLALIAICCVFCFIDHHGSAPIHKGLYDLSTLEHIMERERKTDCDALPVSQKWDKTSVKLKCQAAGPGGRQSEGLKGQANETIPKVQNKYMQKL